MCIRDRVTTGPYYISNPAQSKLDFNGLNYVSGGHARRGPRLTSYSEWTHGGGVPTMHPQPHRSRRRHSSSPKRNDLSHKFQGLVAGVSAGQRRSKSSSKEHLNPSSPARGRPRKRSNNVNSSSSKPHQITNPQHYLRIHTSQPNNASSLVGGHPHPTSLVQTSRSISPSDGMILTASGLRDTLSSDKTNAVVILDGLQDQENVYLAT